MSAAPERREPIDIDEFERRLLSPEPGRRGEDPLVELARLLGQQQASDPVAQLFADNRGAAPGFRPHAVPPVAPPSPQDAPPSIDPFADFPDLRPLMRGGVDDAFPPPPPPPVSVGADMGFAPPAAPAPDFYPEPLPPSARYEDWAEAPELAPEAPALEPPRQRSRKPLYVAGAVIAAGFLAIGSTLAWRGGAHQAGGVAMIAASTAPTKIQPKDNETGDKMPRDSTMLERTPAPTVKKVVSREEQPMDVSAAARGPRVIPLDDGAGASPAASAASASSSTAVTPPPPPVREPAVQSRSAFPEPKRVKTVSVRADGSIIGNDAAPAPAPVAPKAERTPSSPRNATPKSATRADATTTATAKHVAPKPKVEPKPASKPRVAAVEPRADEQPAAEDTAGEEAAAKPVASGGYSLQIASAGSEAEARQTASRLGGRLSGALGGRRPAVVKASDTLYRVRVTGLSKESAVAMCGRVKAAGGACFVAR